MRDGREHSGSIPSVVVAGTGASVIQPGREGLGILQDLFRDKNKRSRDLTKDLSGVLHYLVGPDAVDLDDETHSAGLPLVGWIVKAIRGRGLH